MTCPKAVSEIFSMYRKEKRFALAAYEANRQILSMHHCHYQWGGKKAAIFLQSTMHFTIKQSFLVSYTLDMLTTYVESTLQMELFFYYEIQKFIMNILKSVKLAVSISLTIFQGGDF